MDPSPFFAAILERAQELEFEASVDTLFTARLFRAFISQMENRVQDAPSKDLTEALRERARSLATSGSQETDAEDGWDPGAPYRFASDAFRSLADDLEGWDDYQNPQSEAHDFQQHQDGVYCTNCMASIENESRNCFFEEEGRTIAPMNVEATLRWVRQSRLLWDGGVCAGCGCGTSDEHDPMCPIPEAEQRIKSALAASNREVISREEAAQLVEQCAKDLADVQKDFGGPYGGLNEVSRMPKSKVSAIRRVAEVLRRTREHFFAPPSSSRAESKEPTGVG